MKEGRGCIEDGSLYYAAALRGANLLFSVCEDGSSVPDDMPVDMKFGEH